LLAGPCPAAARGLIGALLVRDGEGRDANGQRRVARIVEVEAYLGIADRASHARFGPTDRNGVMFGPPGIAYVYLVYGMYDCLNVVAEPADRPAAILIRAVEPLAGAERMRAARLASAVRRRPTASPEAERERLAALPAAHLARGPGLVAAAFDIDRSLSGLDLCDPASPLRLEAPDPSRPSPRVVSSPRIGIDYAGAPWTGRRLRFFDPSSPAVSGRPWKR
jgi:DNA-3-methyladenine glycosylase